jgi:hypothetical protein
MCKCSEESIDHLFVTVFFQELCGMKFLQISNGRNKWEQRTLEDCFTHGFLISLKNILRHCLALLYGVSGYQGII